MTNSRKGFIVPIIVFVFAIIGVGASIYYFYSQDKAKLPSPDGAIKAGDSYRPPLSALDQAKLKAAESRSFFERLLARFVGEQKAITSIQQEYAKMSDLLPDTTAAILKKRLPVNVKNDIALLQKKIDDALKSWKEVLAQAKGKNPNLSLADLVAEARNDIANIQAYIQDIQQIINGLTPENSGLSQKEIDDAKAAAQKAIDDAKKEEQAIAKIEEAAQKAQETSTSPTPTATSPTPNPPIVTPEDIAAAADAAKKAEEEKKAQEEAAGINQNPALPTPTPFDYSSYNNNNQHNTLPSSFYDDLTSSGKPEIDGSPSKKQ